MSQSVQRGDVFLANLDPTIGVEIKKTRPVIVVSNNMINRYSQSERYLLLIEEAIRNSLDM